MNCVEAIMTCHFTRKCQCRVHGMKMRTSTLERLSLISHDFRYCVDAVISKLKMHGVEVFDRIQCDARSMFLSDQQ